MNTPNLFDNFDEEPQIDLTPLIDCLFMLIIFFVLTMTFSQPVIEILLPEAKNTTRETQRNEILINVKKDGSLWLDNETQIDLNILSQKLDENPDKILNIYMDKNAAFSHFIEVLDLAKLKREGRFIISTDEAK